MRGRQWKRFAVLTVATFALAACAPEEGAEEGMGDEAAMEGHDMADTAAMADTGAMAGQETNLPAGVTMEMVNQGRTLFTGQAACHACHGPNATGTQLAPNLTDATWINVSGRNFEEITNLIKTGVPQPKEHPGPMPPMGGSNLSDEQVRALAAYVVSIGQG